MSTSYWFHTKGGIDVTVDEVEESIDLKVDRAEEGGVDDERASVDPPEGVIERFHGCNIRQAWNSSVTANGESLDMFGVSSDTKSGITASPIDPVGNNPKEHTRGRKRKGISKFFRKTWKNVKQLFLGNKNRVVPIVPPLKPDTQSCETESAPVSDPAVHANTPDIDSGYPTQTSESLDTYNTMSIRSFSLSEGSTDERSLVEDINVSPIECYNIQTKGGKRKCICRFFQRTWMTAKHLFLCCCETTVEPFEPPLKPETYSISPEIMSVQSSLEQWPDDKMTIPGFSSDAGCSGLQQHQINMHLSQNVEDDYAVGNLLGEGGFGAVYKGTRRADGQKVAIKYLKKGPKDRYLLIPGHSKPLLTEVALMLMVNQPSIYENVIKMYEWFDAPSYIAIAMEYPDPCDDLRYLIHYCGHLKETTACILICQAVLAVNHCIDRGVFHSDIHPANMLVNRETLMLKLIDFSCGQVITYADPSSCKYAGVPAYCPPEVLSRPTFKAVPANIWSLGLVLYEMVNGCLPDGDSEEVLFTNSHLSSACQDVIKWCLTRDPAKRPSFRQMLKHDWFETILENK